MKPLLFDEHTSPRLPNRLADVFPKSVHVSAVGLDKALDGEVWEYARQNDLIIVTKDADFSETKASAWRWPIRRSSKALSNSLKSKSAKAKV